MTEQRITTRCPSCGTANLFVAPSGDLTCSLIGCPNPCAINEPTTPPAAPVQRCGTCEHFNVEGPMNGPGQCYAPGHWVKVPPDGSGFCHLHSEGEK